MSGEAHDSESVAKVVEWFARIFHDDVSEKAYSDQPDTVRFVGALGEKVLGQIEKILPYLGPEANANGETYAGIMCYDEKWGVTYIGVCKVKDGVSIPRDKYDMGRTMYRIGLHDAVFRKEK